MIIYFNLIYNLSLSWLKQNFSRGNTLLHVFWNTLYVEHWWQMIMWQVVSFLHNVEIRWPRYATIVSEFDTVDGLNFMGYQFSGRPYPRIPVHTKW